MDELPPELAKVQFPILSPQAKRLVEAQVDHFAATIAANGDERLRRFAVDAGIGWMLCQHCRLWMRAKHWLIPREWPEIGPGPAMLRVGFGQIVLPTATKSHEI